jgi:hypothetical protein
MHGLPYRDARVLRTSTAHLAAVYSPNAPRLTVAMSSMQLAGGPMARDSRSKFIHIMYLLGFGGVGYLVQRALFPSPWFTAAVVVGWLFALAIWVLLIMPTWCHYDVGDHGCTRHVNGKLGGCYQHSQLKRDAMWAAMKRRNPGLAFRVTWGDSRSHHGRQLGTNAAMSGRIAQQGAYNASMWWFAAISAVGTVVALVIGITSGH